MVSSWHTAPTEDRALNAGVASAARTAGVLVNAVDDIPNCDFFAVSIVRRGYLQVAISTNGLSPAFARWMREYLDARIPEVFGELLEILAEVRSELRTRGPIPAYERWQSAITEEVLSRLRDGDRQGAKDRIVAGLVGEGETVGTVTLIGAGPGASDLITVRGLQRLHSAQVVVYDRLIDPQLLREAPEGAELIFAGKASGFTAIDQRSIESILIEKARAGKRVVRLKGGDPFVFGRGGEEIEALAGAGIPWEVVPGVSSAIAAPAAAGIPVTHRELASTLTIVTGHEHSAKPDSGVDWDWLAGARGTLVVLMGLEQLGSIAGRLLAAGRHPSIPVAVISAGTWPQQQSVISTLERIAADVAAAGLRSPAVIVVGEVARFPETLAGIGVTDLREAV